MTERGPVHDPRPSTVKRCDRIVEEISDALESYGAINERKEEDE